MYDERSQQVWEEKLEFWPLGLAISPSGEVYVCDMDNNYIHTYSLTDGFHLATININSPSAIAVSSTGRRLIVVILFF